MPRTTLHNFRLLSTPANSARAVGLALAEKKEIRKSASLKCAQIPYSATARVQEVMVESWRAAAGGNVHLRQLSKSID